MSVAAKAPIACACAALLAAALSACAKTVSTGAFQGEQHEVAQAISNLQSDVTAGEEREVAQTVADLQSDTTAKDERRVCKNDLASALVARLNKSPGGCARAVKDQREEIDPGLEVNVKSVKIEGSGSARTATARVKSTFFGKSRASTLTFVKEGARWKISGLR